MWRGAGLTVQHVIRYTAMDTQSAFYGNPWGVQINVISFFFFLPLSFSFSFPSFFYPYLRPTLAKFAAICKIKRWGQCRLNSSVIKKLGFWRLKMFRGTTVQLLLHPASRKGTITQANMQSSALATRTRKLFLQNNSLFLNTPLRTDLFSPMLVSTAF